MITISVYKKNIQKMNDVVLILLSKLIYLYNEIFFHKTLIQIFIITFPIVENSRFRYVYMQSVRLAI